jgi:hypothetical protein
MYQGRSNRTLTWLISRKSRPTTKKICCKPDHRVLQRTGLQAETLSRNVSSEEAQEVWDQPGIPSHYTEVVDDQQHETQEQQRVVETLGGHLSQPKHQ